jgi:hypothetical protein
MSNHNQVKSYQQGAVLLVFIAALVMTLAWLSYGLLGDLGQKLKRQQAQDVGMVLAEAKENLLVFAESIPELYAGTTGARQAIGYLPCPDAASLDASTTGSSGTCSWATGAVNYSLGRFPGQKFSGESFFFSIHEKNGGHSIWYAVDDNYRYCGNGTRCFAYTNPTTLTPTMTLDGNQVAAVIIVANSPVSGQVNGTVKNQLRDSTEITRLQWDEYLESLVTTSPSPTFVSRRPTNSNVFNDQIIGITKNELDARIKHKVCSLAIGYCAGAAPAWFSDYGWQILACSGNNVNPIYCP